MSSTSSDSAISMTDFGYFEHTSSNCLARDVDPVEELQHINGNLEHGYGALGSRVHAALDRGEIADRLRKPLEILLDNLLAQSDHQRPVVLETSDIDKEYLPLLSWILFAYGRNWGSAALHDLLNRDNDHELSEPELMECSLEELRSEHDGVSCELRLIDRNMGFEKFGGPNAPRGPHNIHDRAIKKALSANQVSRMDVYWKFKAFISHYLDIIHSCIDKRNALVLENMSKQLMEGNRFKADHLFDPLLHHSQIMEHEQIIRQLCKRSDDLQELVDVRDTQIKTLLSLRNRRGARSAEAESTSDGGSESVCRRCLTGKCPENTQKDAGEQVAEEAEINKEADAYMDLQLSKIQKRALKDLQKIHGDKQPSVEDIEDDDESRSIAAVSTPFINLDRSVAESCDDASADGEDYSSYDLLELFVDLSTALPGTSDRENFLAQVTKLDKMKWSSDDKAHCHFSIGLLGKEIQWRANNPTSSRAEREEFRKHIRAEMTGWKPPSHKFESKDTILAARNESPAKDDQSPSSIEYDPLDKVPCAEVASDRIECPVKEDEHPNSIACDPLDKTDSVELAVNPTESEHGRGRPYTPQETTNSAEAEL